MSKITHLGSTYYFTLQLIWLLTQIDDLLFGIWGRFGLPSILERIFFQTARQSGFC